MLAVMYVSRRRFVVLTSLVALWARCGRLFAAKAQVAEGELEALGAWVDTLLPADDLSPSGCALGVQSQILEKAVSIAAYQTLLSVGLRWANAQAVVRGAVSFAALDGEAREAVVAEAEGEGEGRRTPPGLFFYHTLKDAKQFYYEHEASWAGVGFPHTPQPLGFVDYMEAPK